MRIVFALRDNLFACTLLAGETGWAAIGGHAAFRNAGTIRTNFVRAAFTGVLTDARRGDTCARRAGEPACAIRSGLAQTRSETTAA